MRGVPYKDNHKAVDGVEFKKCSICNEWFEMNAENFYKNKSSLKDGFNPYCKKCTSQKNMKWQQANPERRSISSKKSNAKKEIQARNRKHWKKYVDAGKFDEWKNKNKDKLKMYGEKHRKHDIDEIELEYCKEYFNFQCAYCGIDEEIHKLIYNQVLHKDHVIHDGSNGIENCAPACKICNSHKSYKEFNSWYNEDNENFCEIRLQKIIDWMTRDFINA